MDNSPEMIKQQMEDTRASLTDKLEVLEKQVINTVQDANQTVETVKETVEAVKESVQETVAAVKDTVQGTVATVQDTVRETTASVRDSLSVERQVRAHPWAMFAGAALLGYVGGKLLAKATAPPAAQPIVYVSPPPPSMTLATKTNGTNGTNGTATLNLPKSAEPTFWTKVADQYSDEISKVKSLAISAVGGIARELITQSAPPVLCDDLKQIVDGFTAKMGGEPIEGPILDFDKRMSRPERKAS